MDDIEHTDSTDPNIIIPRFHRWLHHAAYRYWPRDSPEHEDLVQEGRIAMWRAIATFDESKGALTSWITVAADLRMREVATRHGFFGQPQSRGIPRGERRFRTAPLDQNDVPVTAQPVEAADWAYHRDEILAALAALPERQRRYVLARFWCGIKDPEMSKVMGTKGHSVFWSKPDTGARARLAADLGHLKDTA